MKRHLGACLLAVLAIGCEEGAPEGPGLVAADMAVGAGGEGGEGGAGGEGGEVDMAVAPDMAAAPDMATEPDMATVDMGIEPDMAPVCTPVDELCNGLDDDCDGDTDEALPTEPCYEGPAGTEGVGVCQGGMRACVDGAYAGCVGDRGPTNVDECDDGFDNDCDGAADEGCECAAGTTRLCGDSEGACEEGEQQCVDNRLGECEGAVGPVEELCNDVDDDCDGEVDGFDEACYSADPATINVGACRAGARTCNAGAFSGCAGEVLPTAVDLCDNLDADCDGSTDEDFAAQATACGVGACARDGALACNNGNEVDSCVAGQPAAGDACDGVDNDCDGEVDEDFAGGPTACGEGLCAAAGEATCIGGVANNNCTPGDPVDEIDDGEDQDCDGLSDEGIAYTTEVLQSRLNVECAGCHGGNGNFDLGADFVAQSRGVPANGANMAMITPGDPQNSYLYHKIAGTQVANGGRGRQMPLRNAWPAHEIERLRLWFLDLE